MSTPEVTPPVTFPEKFAWLQRRIQTHIRPFHLVYAVAMGLITAMFAVVTLLLLLVVTNFNVLSWIE